MNKVSSVPLKTPYNKVLLSDEFSAALKIFRRARRYTVSLDCRYTLKKDLSALVSILTFE